MPVFEFKRFAVENVCVCVVFGNIVWLEVAVWQADLMGGFAGVISVTGVRSKLCAYPEPFGLGLR